jgi:hypothetical protein
MTDCGAQPQSAWRSLSEDGRGTLSACSYRHEREPVHLACGVPCRLTDATDARLACGRSGLIDLEPFIDSRCDHLQVTGVGANDEIAAANGSLDYASINDVADARPRC